MKHNPNCQIKRNRFADPKSVPKNTKDSVKLGRGGVLIFKN